MGDSHFLLRTVRASMQGDMEVNLTELLDQVS